MASEASLSFLPRCFSYKLVLVWITSGGQCASYGKTLSEFFITFLGYTTVTVARRECAMKALIKSGIAFHVQNSVMQVTFLILCVCFGVAAAGFKGLQNNLHS